MLAGAYWCFVGWIAVEQREPGDTLTHTFDLSPWPVCQIRWFAFRGTVNEVLSPSVSPIFQKHFPGLPPSQKYEFYDDPKQSYTNIYEPNRAGQTFTPTEFHRLTEIYTFMSRARRTYPSLYLEIKRAPDDIPTGPILSSGYTVWAVIPEAPASDWVETPMSLYFLEPDTKYAIIARTAGVGAGILQWWNRYFNATYPRGIHIWSPDAGITWSKFPLEDALFQEWGIPY